MAAITICIERDEQGQYTVGTEPEGQDEGMPEAQEGAEPGMQPAKDIDQALEMARSMLEGAGPTEEQAEGEQAFQQGFNNTAKGGSMLLRRGM